MVKDKPPPGMGQYALSATFGILALAAGAISLSINVTFGLQAGIVTAAIFALSDLAKILLPIVAAALGGWSGRRRIAWTVAVIISVAAAVSYLLEKEGSRLIQSQAAAATHEGARADMDRSRKELVSIDETMSAMALRTLADEAKADAEREEADGGCRTKCEGHKAARAAYLVRLGNAERRDKLHTMLADAKQTAKATPKEALGASDTLAVLTGGDKAQIASVTSIAVSIAMLVILELLATFSGDAGKIFVNARNARRATREPAVKALQTDEITVAKPRKADRNYWLNRLSRERPDIAAKVIAGEISCYAGCLEAGIRKRPAKSWSKPEDFGIVRETV